jgi:general secretion pathway protein A
MEYFQLLNLTKEPFSNSPDPEFFYQSREHLGCLQKLELSIRLRRGLNVVIGDIGTGKTTLCRQLIRECSADRNLETHLILDPHFVSRSEFLSTLAGMFGLTIQDHGSDWQIKEAIKNHLYNWGVDEKKITVLVIDEGQKIPDDCLEILREFLNYETNEHKLLQIVIFAQEEFRQILAQHRNFADRINFYHVIRPLNFRETRMMLRYRLTQAKGGHKDPKLFTGPGLLAVYRATGGYPRKIVHLCHRALMTLIIQNRTRAGWGVVRWCSKMLFPGQPLRMSWKVPAAAAAFAVVLGIVFFAPRPPEIPFFGKMSRTGFISTELEEPRSPLVRSVFRAPIPLSTVESVPALVGRERANTESGERPDKIFVAPGELSSILPNEEVSADVDAPGGTQVASLAATATSFSASPDKPDETLAARLSPPGVLGQITIRPGDNLEQMIRRVYGVFDQQYLRAVLQINPQISDSNNIDVGRAVLFPPLSVRIGTLRQNGCWLRVAERNTLEEAYQVLRDFPRFGPPLVLLPQWNPHNDLRFGLLLRDCCVDQQAAESALRKMPLSLAVNAEVLSKWEEDVILVAK